MSNRIESAPGVNGTAGHATEPVTATTAPARQNLNLHTVWNAVKKLSEEVHAARAEPPRPTDAPLLKILLAVVAGCTTPVLALAMSTLTGTVARQQGDAAWFALLPGLCLVAMLVVSTPHIAEAKGTLGWARWQSWSFAVGLDFAIVVSELLSVWCDKALADVWWLPQLVILGSVAYSATLNSYVNLLHTRWSKVIDPRGA
jgi:hypothetical protein